MSRRVTLKKPVKKQSRMLSGKENRNWPSLNTSFRVLKGQSLSTLKWSLLPSFCFSKMKDVNWDAQYNIKFMKILGSACRAYLYCLKYCICFFFFSCWLILMWNISRQVPFYFFFDSSFGSHRKITWLFDLFTNSFFL